MMEYVDAQVMWLHPPLIEMRNGRSDKALEFERVYRLMFRCYPWLCAGYMPHRLALVPAWTVNDVGLVVVAFTCRDCDIFATKMELAWAVLGI
jgi:hypothetical protein